MNQQSSMTTTISTTQKPKQPMRSVTFEETVNIRPIPAASSSVDDLILKHYTSNDFATFQGQCFRLVNMMEHGVSEEQIQSTTGETTCSLEKMTAHYREHGSKQMSEIRNAVFLLQEEAKHSNPSITAERIAKVYARMSAPWAHEASVKGFNHQTFVREDFMQEQQARFSFLHHVAFQNAQRMIFFDQQRYCQQQQHSLEQATSPLS